MNENEFRAFEDDYNKAKEKREERYVINKVVYDLANNKGYYVGKKLESSWLASLSGLTFTEDLYNEFLAALQKRERGLIEEYASLRR